MENQVNIFGLTLDGEVSDNLLETARWAKLIGIFSIIMSALGLLGGFGASYAISAAASRYGATPLYQSGYMTGFFIGYTIVFIGIYIYPIIALMRFANYTKIAISSSNQQRLADGIRNLKGLFKYLGILMIICGALVLIYFFLFIIALA